MKRLLFLIPFLLMVSCKKEENHQSRSYDSINVDISVIEWSEILSQKEKFYYSYVYSDKCGHCNEIKDQIVSFALDGKYKIYFISYDTEIPIITNDTNNIGKTDYHDLGIVGTPTLFEIGGGMVVNCHTGSSLIISTLTKDFND